MPVELLVIAVLHGDVEHATRSATVVGGHATLDQLDVLHGIGVEHAEEAEKVAGVVHGGVVQQDQVLVRATAAYIEAAVAFAVALHTGQVLDRLEDINFTQQRWKRAQLLHVQFHCAHLGAFSVLGLFAHHLEFLGHDGFGACIQVQLQVRLQVHHLAALLEAHIAHYDGVLAGWQVEHVVPICVGGGTCHGLLGIHVRADKGLTGGRIFHITADGEVLLGLGEQTTREENKKEQRTHGGAGCGKRRKTTRVGDRERHRSYRSAAICHTNTYSHRLVEAKAGEFAFR